SDSFGGQAQGNSSVRRRLSDSADRIRSGRLARVLVRTVRERRRLRTGRGVLQERRQQFDRQRKNDGGILIGGDFRESLQVAHLHRHWIGGHDLGGFPELGGGLELSLCVNHFRPPRALGLGLGGHRPLHRIGQI